MLLRDHVVKDSGLLLKVALDVRGLGLRHIDDRVLLTLENEGLLAAEGHFSLQSVYFVFDLLECSFETVGQLEPRAIGGHLLLMDCPEVRSI